MLLLRFWNYIRGYVIIVVEGNFLEKFINICIHRQIFLWDIKKTNNNKMLLKMSIKGFFLLKPIARKTGCRIRIRSKRGLPFLLNKYKSRKTFLFGAVIAVALIYTLTSFIWVVEVKGNKNIETEKIIERISSLGVKPGTIKFGIDTKKLTNEMMLSMKELAWISITVKGTKLKVNIAERITPPDIVEKDKPCNIIAKRDGVVKSTLAKMGLLKVKTGDMVKKGDVLISGTVTSESKDIQPYFVHAIGNVLATTWYEKTCAVESKIMERVRTGKVLNKYSLNLFTNRVKLYLGKAPQGDYDKVEIKKTLSIGNDLELPFGLIVDKYYEEKVVEKKLTLEEGRKIAANKAYNAASDEIPENVEIIKTNTTYFEAQGKQYADIIIECSEDIGITKAIGGN